MNIDKTTNNTDFIESVEDKLISIFLNDNDSAVEGNVYLIPRNFLKRENAIIFGAIKELIENSKSVDETTVLAILNAHDDRQFPNYKTYIIKLISAFTSTSNLKEYIEIVKNASVKRELDKICREIIEQQLDFNSFDKEITKRIKEFNEVAWDRKTNDITDISEIIKSSLSVTNQKNYDKVETGFRNIDTILNGGFGKGELDVIAAAPAVGKSAFAINVLANECENLIDTPVSPNHKPPMVFYVSIEMNGDEIFERLVSFKAGKNFKLKEYRENNYSKEDTDLFTIAIDRIRKYPLKTNHTFHASVNDIAAQMSQISNAYDLKLVIIDHLHIMDYDKTNENSAIADITKRLKALAKEYDAPIVLLSQVNKTKAAFDYSSKFKQQQQPNTPQANNTDDQASNAIGMNDLRGSGAIAQDASVIIMMWRKDPLVHFFIAKNRSGATGNLQLKFEGKIYRFFETRAD